MSSRLSLRIAGITALTLCGVTLAPGRPARADILTTYERCSSHDLTTDIYDGAWKTIAVPWIGRTGIVPLLNNGGGSPSPSWNCAHETIPDQTRCPSDAQKFEIIRTGQDRFRVDCYDRASLEALRAAS